MPLNRVSDRLMVSHTTCRSHLWFVPAGPCFALHFMFVISCCQVCLCHPLRSRQARVCVCVLLCLSSTASSASIIIPSILFPHSPEWIPRPSQPGQRRVLPCFSRRRLVEIRSSRSHFRPLFCCTHIHFFTGTARDRYCRDCRDHHRQSSGLLCPRNRCEKLVSPLGSSVLHVVSTDMNSSVFSFVRAITPLLHRNSSFLSSASWFLIRQISPKGTSSSS